MGNKYKHKAKERNKAELPPKATMPSKRETERAVSQKVYELFSFPAMMSMLDDNYSPKDSPTEGGF